jgi:hypothetical protein
VGSVLVVVNPPVLEKHMGFEKVVELPAVQELVAKPAVERLDPFCDGEPGSMNTVPTPLNRHQSATAGDDELRAVEFPTVVVPNNVRVAPPPGATTGCSETPQRPIRASTVRRRRSGVRSFQ